MENKIRRIIKVLGFLLKVAHHFYVSHDTLQSLYHHHILILRNEEKDSKGRVRNDP